MEQYEKHVEKLSHQLYQLNESQLDLKKTNEYMKNKMRYMENNPRSSKQQLSVAASVGKHLIINNKWSVVMNFLFSNLIHSK